MTGRPQPERRYADDARQAAYEAGFAQEYDHDSFALLDRIEVAVADVADEASRCDARAAWLFGASDALAELAERQEESVVLWRAPDGSDVP